MRTKYHELKEKIVGFEDWQIDEKEKNELTTIIDELYLQDLKRRKKENENGKFGLKYFTIHDDSKYWDEHKVFFTTKKERDLVYENWSKGLYWDELFKTYIPYPTPGSNYSHDKTVKIDKEWVVREVETK